jgi:hypothetical protein
MSIRKQEVKNQSTAQRLPISFPREHKPIGSLTTKIFKLFDGITLVEKTMITHQDFNCRFEIPTAMASLWFCLSGIEQIFIRGARDEVVYHKGMCGLFIGQEGAKGSVKIHFRDPFRLKTPGKPVQKGLNWEPAPDCRMVFIRLPILLTRKPSLRNLSAWGLTIPETN